MQNKKSHHAALQQLLNPLSNTAEHHFNHRLEEGANGPS